MDKRIKAPIYTRGKYGKNCREILDVENEYLYPKGLYSTKIKQKDLPEDYIEIQSRTLWYMTGYLKTSRIVDMKYEMRKINRVYGRHQLQGRYILVLDEPIY